MTQKQAQELTEVVRTLSHQDNVTVIYQQGLLPSDPGSFVLEWDDTTERWGGKVSWGLPRTFEAAKMQIEDWFLKPSVMSALIKGYEIARDPRPRSVFFPLVCAEKR